jgi:tripartite-type tricarboxylate transporter receptor subunit TctC
VQEFYVNRRQYKALSLILPLVFLVAGCGGDDPLTNKDIKADYYKGKTITWIVSGSAGGGTDVLTRAYAPFLSKYLEGHPKVQFKYLTGGGGIEAGNYIYNVAKKDGLTLATLGSENLFSQILGEDGVKYQFQKLTFLGNFLARDQMLFVRGDFGVDNFDELMDASEPPKIGARTASHSTALLPLILQGSFPDKKLFDMVYGYDGGEDVDLDVERGALDGRSNSVGSVESTHQDWIDDKFLVPLVYEGQERHPDFPDVPTVGEVVPPEHQDLIALLRAPDLTTRPPVAPPGLPSDLSDMLRKAFEDMSNDPDFEKTVEDLGYPFQWITPDQEADAVTSVLSDKDLEEDYKGLVGDEG